MFCITEKDILNVYKEQGKLKEYQYCIEYLRFMRGDKSKLITEISHEFNVTYLILLKWKNGKSSPYGIKCLNFLKERDLLPYYPNERTSRIVGFLHGDGFLLKSLLGFGFVSKDKNYVLTKDVEEDLKISKELVNSWMLYLYKNNFVIRKRRKDRWFEYCPRVNNINRVLKNPLKLEELPKLKI